MQLTRFVAGRAERIDAEFRPTTAAGITVFSAPPYLAERANPTATLNFVIPAAHMSDTLVADVEIWTTGHHGGVTRTGATAMFTCTAARTLTVAGVFVRSRGRTRQAAPLPSRHRPSLICRWLPGGSRRPIPSRTS